MTLKQLKRLFEKKQGSADFDKFVDSFWSRFSQTGGY